ncbi:MAG: hypothetical protein ACE5LU_30350 [Anaerolineae bacterium]
MNVQVQTLKADIRADLEAIANIYLALHRYDANSLDDEQVIIVAYYLHNLYSAFESIFQHIAMVFGNQISDQAGWHAELLRHMTLDIEGIRPRVISETAYDALDELRRFRHVFRSAYRARLDAERLDLVRREAQALEQAYRDEIEGFLAFLDSLKQADTQPPVGSHGEEAG